MGKTLKITLDSGKDGTKNSISTFISNSDVGVITNNGDGTMDGEDASMSVVKDVLSHSTYKLSELCASTLVNDWSFFKPANYNTGTYAGNGQEAASGATANYRLGDFLCYNHDALPPSYWVYEFHDPVYTAYDYFAVDQGDDLSLTFALSKGEMLPTSTRNGYDPNFFTYEDGDASALVGVTIEVNDVSIGELIEHSDTLSWTENVGKAYNDFNGKYVKGWYWTRASTVHSWVKQNEIEDGGELITVTVTEFPIQCSGLWLFNPDQGSPEYQLDTGKLSEAVSMDIDIGMINNSASPVSSRNYYWRFRRDDGSYSVTGMFTTSFTASETKTIYVTSISTTLAAAEYAKEIYHMEVYLDAGRTSENSIGESIDYNVWGFSAS